MELGIFSRGARMRVSLDWVTGLFLGTLLLFLGTLLLFLGTLLLFLGTLSTFSETWFCRGGTRGGWLWWGSWIQKRRLSCNGDVLHTSSARCTSLRCKGLRSCRGPPVVLGKCGMTANKDRSWPWLQMLQNEQERPEGDYLYARLMT